MSESKLPSPSVSTIQIISLSRKRFGEPTSCFLASVLLSPNPYRSPCGLFWVDSWLSYERVSLAWNSFSNDLWTFPWWSAHNSWSQIEVVLKSLQEPTTKQLRGKLGYRATSALLCHGWLPVSDGWDHGTKGSLLILDFFWIQASLPAAWGAVKAFLWHTTPLSKKTSPSYEIAPLLSAQYLVLRLDSQTWATQMLSHPESLLLPSLPSPPASTLPDGDYTPFILLFEIENQESHFCSCFFCAYFSGLCSKMASG